ncbi:MAG: hypothetical protein ACR2K6_04865 [Solirubrobacterales bacterium]
MEAIGAGLCDSCAHQQVVPNTRGSRFSLCRRSKEDPRFPRYPRIPVRECPGYERAGEAGIGRARDQREAR